MAPSARRSSLLSLPKLVAGGGLLLVRRLNTFLRQLLTLQAPDPRATHLCSCALSCSFHHFCQACPPTRKAARCPRACSATRRRSEPFARGTAGSERCALARQFL